MYKHTCVNVDDDTHLNTKRLHRPQDCGGDGAVPGPHDGDRRRRRRIPRMKCCLLQAACLHVDATAVVCMCVLGVQHSVRHPFFFFSLVSRQDNVITSTYAVARGAGLSECFFLSRSSKQGAGGGGDTPAARALRFLSYLAMRSSHVVLLLCAATIHRFGHEATLEQSRRLFGNHGRESFILVVGWDVGGFFRRLSSRGRYQQQGDRIGRRRGL